ncbi:MAG: ABC transporter ATP-binding protein [Thermoproteota archaeon]
MADHLLEIEDLKGYYRGTFGVVYGVDGVTLTLDSGEVLGLAGESGCGKSTLAELVSATPPRTLRYEGGKIIVDGFDIYHISPEILRKEVKCKRMAYVPQASMESLNPVKKISSFLMDVMKERTGEKPKEEEVINMAGEHLKKLGLEPWVLDRYPFELSGGMKQRVVIGISTLWNPKLLIVDEPTSALDVVSQKNMIKALLDLKQANIIESILFISHDISTLRQICDRFAVMYAGKIVETGATDEIINSPLHPYTQGLMTSIVSYEPRRRERGRYIKSIPGEHPDLRNPPPGCRFHPRCPYAMDVCRTEAPPIITSERGAREVSCWLYSRGGR